MNEVERFIKAQIRENGPISVEQFFLIAASGHPQSYYASREPFGRDGDFITAPEISQVFGECIGLWCVDTWEKMGAPPSFRLVELGPGNGTLMSDILRVARIRPAFLRGARVELVETSPRLRDVQRARLAGMAEITWHASAEVLAAGAPLIVVCNEFFDALPARQFVKLNGRWRERMVGLDPNERLVFALDEDADFSSLVPARLAGAQDGSVHEISTSAIRVAGALGEALVGSTGALLAIDYGYEGPATGDTLQALRAHAPCPVLAAPGSADITFHVDFDALAGSLMRAGAKVWPVRGQGEFLRDLGAGARTEIVSRHATPAQAQALQNALTRLTAPEAMGTLFKVLCASFPPSLVPAGFSR
jgi:NADH dehydrogenase [ubiquinone] 1 alpha subcomplex assembly factor 7